MLFMSFYTQKFLANQYKRSTCDMGTARPLKGRLLVQEEIYLAFRYIAYLRNAANIYTCTFMRGVLPWSWLGALVLHRWVLPSSSRTGMMELLVPGSSLFCSWLEGIKVKLLARLDRWCAMLNIMGQLVRASAIRHASVVKDVSLNPTAADCWVSEPQCVLDLPTNWEQIGAV